MKRDEITFSDTYNFAIRVRVEIHIHVEGRNEVAASVVERKLSFLFRSEAATTHCRKDDATPRSSSVVLCHYCFSINRPPSETDPTSFVRTDPEFLVKNLSIFCSITTHIVEEAH